MSDSPVAGLRESLVRVRFAGCHVPVDPGQRRASPPRLPRSPDFRSGPEQFPRSRVIYFGGGSFMKVQSWAVFILASPLPA
jgi:hypothetical protein